MCNEGVELGGMMEEQYEETVAVEVDLRTAWGP